MFTDDDVNMIGRYLYDLELKRAMKMFCLIFLL